MGGVKDMLIEHERFDWELIYVEFQCPECGGSSCSGVELPVVDRGYEADAEFEVDMKCTECGAEFSSTFECGGGAVSLTLDEHPKVETSFEIETIGPPLDDYDWEYEQLELQQYYLENASIFPAETFRIAREEFEGILDSNEPVADTTIMRRMIFSQSFSAFEAFLCDMLLSFIFAEENRRKAIVFEPPLKDAFQFKTEELFDHIEHDVKSLIDIKIKNLIKGVLFHDFDKAEKLYTRLKIELFPDKDIKDFLKEAVGYRHHNTHRNGRDLDGKELTVFTKDYCLKTLAAMETVVNHLEDKKIDETETPF